MWYISSKRNIIKNSIFHGSIIRVCVCIGPYPSIHTHTRTLLHAKTRHPTHVVINAPPWVPSPRGVRQSGVFEWVLCTNGLHSCGYTHIINTCSRRGARWNHSERPFTTDIVTPWISLSYFFLMSCFYFLFYKLQ